MPNLRRLASKLLVGTFVSLGDASISTFLACDELITGFQRLSDLKGASLGELEGPIRNANWAGLAHVATPSDWHLAGGGHELPTLRILGLPGDTAFAEIAFRSRLIDDLHESGPDCFESYELRPTGVLLTPDLVMADGESTEIVCAFARLPTGVSLKGTQRFSVRVACTGRPGTRQFVDYEIEGFPFTTGSE